MSIKGVYRVGFCTVKAHEQCKFLLAIVVRGSDLVQAGVVKLCNCLIM